MIINAEVENLILYGYFYNGFILTADFSYFFCYNKIKIGGCYAGKR